MAFGDPDADRRALRWLRYGVGSTRAGFPNQEPSWLATPAGCLNRRFQRQHRDRQGPDQETLGTPSLGVDQHTGEEVGQAVVAVYWEHVCDFLAGPADDP